MKISRSRNTKERGIIEYLVYPEKGKFLAVCLTFDILEEGSDRQKMLEKIQEAALLHVETVIKHNLPDELLNRYAPEKYWKKYFGFQEELKKRQIERGVADAIQRAYTRQTLKSLDAQRFT